MIFLVGCASNSANKKTSIYSKTSEIILHILRPDNRVASAVGIEVFVNGEEIAIMKTNSLLIYPIKPGKYLVKIGEGTEKDLFLAQEIKVDLTSQKQA